MRLDGFRIYAAEKRIVVAANLVAFHAVAFAQLAKNSRGGAVHGIKGESEFAFANAFPINQRGKFFKIRIAGVQGTNQIRARWQRSAAAGENRGQLPFDLRNDSRQGRTAIAGFVFHSVPAIGIVTGGNHDSAGSAALANKQGKRGRSTRRVGEPDRSSG